MQELITTPRILDPSAHDKVDIGQRLHALSHQDGRAMIQTVRIPNFELASGLTINVRSGFCVFAEQPGILDLTKPTVVLLSNISGGCTAAVPKGVVATQCDGWFNHAIGKGAITVKIGKEEYQLEPLLNLEKVNVVCFDFLGGNGFRNGEQIGSTSAHELGANADKVQLIDSVRLQTTVLREYFGIENVTVVGGSLGGICALQYLSQDLVKVDKVLDISSPSKLSERTREFMSAQHLYLTGSANHHMLLKFISKLQEEFDANPTSTPGYHVALEYSRQRIRVLGESNDPIEKLKVCRIFSFLNFLPPKGFDDRFIGWQGKGREPVSEMHTWLHGNAENYAKAMDPKGYANLARMMACFQGHDLQEIATGARMHGATLGRFLVPNDTLVCHDIESSFNSKLCRNINLSIIERMDASNAHDHFLVTDFARTSAPDLKVFLESVKASYEFGFQQSYLL